MQQTALQHATGRADNMQRCNMLLQPATCSVALTCSMQHAQRIGCNRHHAQRTALQRTPLQHATGGIATCNKQNRQHAMLQQGTSTCNMQRCSNLHHATRTTDRMQRTTCTTDSIATGSIATATRNGIATDSMQLSQHLSCTTSHATCNVKHATDQRARCCDPNRGGP